ncbi:MAG: SUMF1/EgtB/PvdO family nonheme iron enzyme, partial [Verrucomicrobiia bacterium]
MKKCLVGVLAALSVLALGNTRARAAITIDLVQVGNPGNAADPLNSGSVPGIGSVSYAYAIATTEVNLSQYTAFLNAVAATDTYSLYNTGMGTTPDIAGITQTGSSGSYSYAVMGTGARPVTYVSWFDAARFANWVANGQPTGGQTSTTTENGAYMLNGAMSGVSVTLNAVNPNTSATTTYWIPSE